MLAMKKLAGTEIYKYQCTTHHSLNEYKVSEIIKIAYLSFKHEMFW